jgi:hypothetical protein
LKIFISPGRGHGRDGDGDEIFFLQIFFSSPSRPRPRSRSKKIFKFCPSFFSSTLISSIINKKISPSLHLGKKPLSPPRAEMSFHQKDGRIICVYLMENVAYNISRCTIYIAIWGKSPPSIKNEGVYNIINYKCIFRDF